MFNRGPRRKDFIVGAATGSGAIAMAAVEGGVDLILVLNAGRFRIKGKDCVIQKEKLSVFVVWPTGRWNRVPR